MDNNSCTTAFNLLKEELEKKIFQNSNKQLLLSFTFLSNFLATVWRHDERTRVHEPPSPLKTDHKPTDSSHSDSWTRVHTARPSRRIAEINGRKGSINPSKKTEGVGGGAYFSLLPGIENPTELSSRGRGIINIQDGRANSVGTNKANGISSEYLNEARRNAAVVVVVVVALMVLPRLVEWQLRAKGDTRRYSSPPSFTAYPYR